MKTEFAQAVNDAIAIEDHPLLDYQTDVAKGHTQWIYEYLKPYAKHERRFLEIGCGSGKHTFRAEEIGFYAAGIDCSEGMIARAEKVKARISSSVAFVVADFLHMPFADCSFDCALFHKNIIESSYEEYEQLLDEVRRILRPSGVFFLTLVDGIRTIEEKGQMSNYDAIRGVRDGTITVPGKEPYPYPTSFWTVAFANHLTQKRFELLHHEYIDSKPTILLTYRVKEK